MEKRVCISCGADISESAVFCEKCGTKQPTPEPRRESCTYCGAELRPDAMFCVNCGAKAENAKQTDFDIPKKDARNPKKLIASVVTFAVALGMLLLSFFPVATYDFSETAGLDGFEISFSPMDHVILLFDSMKSMDEEDLAESDLAEEGQKVSEELAEEIYGPITDYDDLDREAQELLQEMIFLTLRMGMSAELADGSMGPFLATATILSVVYVLIAIALAVVSLFYLLSAIGILFKEKNDKLKNATLSLLLALPTLLWVRLIAENVIWSPTGRGELTVASIFVLLLSADVLVMHMLVHLLDGGTFQKRVLIPRAISSLLAILLIIAVFMPAMNVRIREQFEGRTRKVSAEASMPATLLGGFLVSDNDEDMFDEMEEHQNTEEYAQELEAAFDFSVYTKKDVEKGTANMDIFYAMFVIGAPYAFQSFSRWFAMIAFFMTLAALGAMLVLWQNLLYFAGGRPLMLVIRLSKICSCMLAVAALVLIIVFLSMMTIYLDSDLPGGARFSVGIGAGLIVATVVTFANVLVPSRVGEKKYVPEEEPHQFD